MSKPETETKTTAQSTTPPPPKADAKTEWMVNPFAPWLREHAARLESISDEVAAFERAMMERIKTNAADVAALVQDTLDYVQQVGGEWRKIAIDTARRAADFTGKA
jgi:hypothetical protein